MQVVHESQTVYKEQCVGPTERIEHSSFIALDWQATSSMIRINFVRSAIELDRLKSIRSEKPLNLAQNTSKSAS